MNLNITRSHIDSDLLELLIKRDMESEAKQFMATADDYFKVKNDSISSRRKMMMLLDDDENPYLRPDYSKANNQIKHAYLQELINQCTNYLAGKPLKIDYKQAFDDLGAVTPQGDEEVTEGLSKADSDKILIEDELYKNNNFVTFIQSNVENVQLYGKSYFRIVKDYDDHIRFVIYDPKEIIMFKDDYDEPILCIRYFEKPEIEVKNGKTEIVNVMYAEVFDDLVKDTWVKKTNKYELQDTVPVYSNRISFSSVVGEPVEYQNILDFGVFPIIEWKFNQDEIPTLSNIKDFIDMQDINLSDLANNVEDIQEAIWILENYNGQNLGEFLEDLKVKKAIKVGAGGGAHSETVEIPIEARTRLYELSTKNIYKFGFGIDFSERDSLGNVSGVALKWSYAPLEQKANAIENNAQDALDKFFNILFQLKGLPYDSNQLEFIFDRTMIANEQEQTATVMSASAQLSQKTILDNLPMVKDTEDELERLENENEYEPKLPEEVIETGEEDEEDSDEGNESLTVLPFNPNK